MNKIVHKNHDFIPRFSCSLLGKGRKQSGHKIFLKSLFLLRNNEEKKLSFLKSSTVVKNALNKEEKLKHGEERQFDLLKFLVFKGFSVKTIQNGIKKWKDQGVFSTIIEKKENALSTIINSTENFDKKGFSYLGKIDKEAEKSSAFAERESYKKSSQDQKKNKISSQNIYKISDTPKNKAFLRKAENLQKENFDKEDLERTISQLSNHKFLEICKEHVKPILETRNVRKGRVTYKVPLVTRPERQQGKAIAWLIDNASLRKKNKKEGFPQLSLRVPFDAIKDNISSEKAESVFSKAIDDRKNHYRSIKSHLASLLSDSFVGKGESVERRKEFHKTAVKNRSYLSYRWW